MTTSNIYLALTPCQVVFEELYKSKVTYPWNSLLR